MEAQIILRYPLRKNILLITTGGIFSCRLVHANDEYLTAVDVKLKKQDPMNGFSFIDIEILGKIFFNRNSVVGYSMDEKYMYKNNDLKFFKKSKFRGEHQKKDNFPKLIKINGGKK